MISPRQLFEQSITSQCNTLQKPRQNVVVYARKLTCMNEECSASGTAFTA